MAIRVRKDGSMWCAALTPAEPGDTYIDDWLHYEMSVEKGVLVALPWPEHRDNPRWWWVQQAPPEADLSMVPPSDPATRFSQALTALPGLAKAAGCYVGIKVTAAK